METTLILILLLAPFFGFLVNLIFGKKMSSSLPGLLATSAVAVSFAVSLFYFIQIQQTGTPIKVHLFNWISLDNFEIGFDFTLDQLSLLWLMVVTGIGALIHIYSIGYMKGDENIDRYFSYLNLFIFFMIILVTGSNLLMMFIGWEGVGLCSYLLIGFWYKNQKFNDAAKKAFIMNRIGDLGFLIGAFTLAFIFNTLDFDAMKTASGFSANSLLGIATLFLFIGATGKSAQIPLYTWLPDAMAGPTPVSALIHAATMVTAGIFMITRLNFLFDMTPDVQLVIATVGAVTALFAATIAMVQTDIKKVLAYSTVSQLGLMFLAIGCGAYSVAVFHVVTHAFFKACLFLGSGSVIHAMGGEQDMRRMGGLKAVMGITFMTFFISTLSISGIPPFAGFFSKDEIMLVAFEHNIVLWALGALASLLTAFYMFRALYLTFYNDFRGTKEQKEHLHESPKSMTTPLIILAILAVVGGAIALPFGYNWLNNYLTPILPQLAHGHETGATQWIIMGVSIAIALAGWGWAYNKYIKKQEVPVEDKDMEGVTKVLYNAYNVNEWYNKLFVKPIYALSGFFNKTEALLLGGISSIVKGTKGLSDQLRLVQNGSLGLYLFVFVLGFCGIIAYLFLA